MSGTAINLAGSYWEYSNDLARPFALRRLMYEGCEVVGEVAVASSKVLSYDDRRYGQGFRRQHKGTGLASNNPISRVDRRSQLKQYHLQQRHAGVQYRCEAKSVIGFVQQLACCYLPHGYWFYVTGRVPEHKAPDAVDRKLLEKYTIGISRQSRARRKAAGLANVHYLRCGRHFVLLATHGLHLFYEHESEAIRDVRRVPIKFEGYSIAYKRGGYKRKATCGEQPVRDDKWHARVQIGRETYCELKAYFLEMARRRRADELAKELYNLPFEPYAPVRQQLLNILRLVNRTRKAAGLEPLDPQVLRYRRRIVKPFDVVAKQVAA